jgi:hypothetical protein
MDAGRQPVTGDTAYTDPRWSYPEYPPGSVIEIRVHGVGGEPPSGMTRDPQPRLVGGDRIAGFWRARNPEVGALPGDGARSHVREVLAWGGQTSGTIRHAFWVLLLPFALFNLAGRMHRSDPDSGWSVVHRAACRVLAYTMTLATVSITAGIALDLVGVQCATAPGCLDRTGTGRVLLAPIRRFADDPLARLALLALLPVAVVLLLWWAGRYRTRELEGLDTGGGQPAPREPVRLQDAGFWRNAWPTSRLRATHATGAFALISATMALVMLDLAPVAHWSAWRLGLVVSVLVAVGAGAVAAAPSTLRPLPHPGLGHTQWVLRLLGVLPGTVGVTLALVPVDLAPRGLWSGAVRLVGVGLAGWWVRGNVRAANGTAPDVTVAGNLWLVAGIALVAATFPATIGALDAARAPLPGALPVGMGTLPTNVADGILALAPGLYVPAHLALLPIVTVQAVLVVLLVATGWERRPALRPDASPLDTGPAVPANLGGAVVALLALLILTASGGSVHALVLDWLGQRLPALPGGAGAVPPLDPAEGAALVLPWWHSLTAVVATVVLPIALGGLLLVRWGLQRWAPGFRASAPTPQEVADDLDRGLAADAARGLDAVRANPATAAARLRVVGARWRTAHLLRDAGVLLFGAVAVTLAVVIGQFVRVAVDPARPVDAEFRFTTYAVWAMALLAVAAVGLIRSGLSEESTRRNVGRLWDVLTYWPRVTHPFAPPCYGEAVVPMLADRIRRLTGHGNRYRVLLAGHSQGSVVALAAVATATAGDPRRVALVSYGSPIAVLYERFFRGVFGATAGAFGAARGAVSSWHHLFAMTEPFAFPFWRVTVPDDVPAAAQRAGWGVNRAVTHADTPCPACGWWRGRETGAATAGGGAPDPGTTPGADDSVADVVVSDPDRWWQPLDPRAPQPRGHSTYHDHREVDLHLAHLAERL